MIDTDRRPQGSAQNHPLPEPPASASGVDAR